MGTALAGAAGLAAGIAATAGQSFALARPGLLPLSGLSFTVDPLSGFFLAVTGAVAVAAGVYAVGSARHSGASRTASAVLPLFAASMLGVPAAGSVGTFLMCWELMALTSLLLVLAEHRRRAEVAVAGRWYAVMTHLGFLCILTGLMLAVARSGGDGFTAVRAAAPHLSPALAGTAFVLALSGFAGHAAFKTLLFLAAGSVLHGTGGREPGPVSGLVTLRLAGIAGALSPLLTALALLAVTVAAAAGLRALPGRRARRAARLSDCGAGPLSARMEYTATSFAEPLQRVFDDVVAPEADIDVTHADEARYLVAAVQYRRRVPDRVERRLYRPVLADFSAGLGWVMALALALMLVITAALLGHTGRMLLGADAGGPRGTAARNGAGARPRRRPGGMRPAWRQ